MRFFRKAHPELGAAPGSLVARAESFAPQIEVLDFGPGHHDISTPEAIEELRAHRDSPNTTWIDVQGLGDLDKLRDIAEIFDVHPLALEDAVNTPVRPKSEVYEDHHLIVLRMVRLLPDGELERSQVTLYVGEKVLLSFQERPGDVFDPVRRRTKQGNRMPSRGPDYLAYALIDMVIDSYFPILEPIAQHLDELEEEITQRPARDQVQRVLHVRHELQELRRDMWPMREMVYQMLREESPFFREETLTFLRDCSDHAVQIVEVIDSYLDLSSQLIALHGAAMSNRMNEIMKVLTMMSTIFIPLSFLAGIYGMNFERMPELGLPWAYPVLLGVMVAIAVVLLWLFRRKGWLGRD